MRLTNRGCRTPSKLEEIQADHWLAEDTTDLIDLLNVLGLSDFFRSAATNEAAK